MNVWRGVVMACVLFALGCVTAPAAPAADRDKLLNETGVYGTFAAFRFDADTEFRPSLPP